MGSKTAPHSFAPAALAAALILSATAVRAQVVNEQGAFGKVIRIDRNGFKPNAGRITFSEFPVGSKNPTYSPSNYGGDATGITVTFGGLFTGQRMGDANVCPGGGALSGCVAGVPGSPLTLDPSSPVTQIATDRSAPDSPVLSGLPLFNGPVSILFDRDLAGVGLQGGYFNALKSTAIRAFDRSGRQIGGVVNLALGIEYMALVTEDGSESIAGLQFSLVGPEPAGFAIDNLSFARRSELQRPVTKPDNGGGAGALGGLFKDKQQSDRPVTPAPRSLKDIFK